MHCTVQQLWRAIFHDIELQSQTQSSSDSSSSSLERDRRPEELEEEREQMKKDVIEMEGAIEKEKEKEGGDRDASVEDEDPSEGDQEAVFAKTPFFTYAGHAADLLDISWSKVSDLSPLNLSTDIEQVITQGCENSDFNHISDLFCSSQNSFQTFNALKSTSFQAFQIILDSFRLFLTDVLSHPWHNS